MSAHLEILRNDGTENYFDYAYGLRPPPSNQVHHSDSMNLLTMIKVFRTGQKLAS